MTTPPVLEDAPPPSVTLDVATRQQLVGTIYEQHSPLLKQLATARAGRYGLHRSWAEDIVHELFIPLIDASADHLLVGAPETLADYLYTGLETRCQSTGRSERRRAARADTLGASAVAAHPFATPDAILEGDGLLELIDCVLARCAPEKAAAWRLVRILKHRQTDVARQLGVSISALAHRLVEPERRVRQAIEAWRTGRVVGAARASMGEGARA